MAPVLEVRVASCKTQMEFPTPGFDLAQHWLYWALGSVLADGRFVSLLFYFSK